MRKEVDSYHECKCNCSPASTTYHPKNRACTIAENEEERAGYLVDSLKGDASKKARNTVAESLTTSIIFGDMIKYNFKDEDIVNRSKRGKEKASFCLKQVLGEAFFHGLDLVGSLEAENSKLQKSLTSTKTSSNYYKRLLDGAEKKIEDMKNNHNTKLKKIKDAAEK